MKLATDVYFKLHDGHKIPALGLGTVPPEDHSEVKQQVITAIKAGYRHIDTAWYYGVEEYVGAALKEVFEEGIVERKDIFVTTKVWPSFYHSPEKSLDKSLTDLGLDYVDLLLQHWPIALKGGPDGLPAKPTDDEGNLAYADDPVSGRKYLDVYHELERIKDETSKVRSIGVSNYSIKKLTALLKEAKHIPVVNQIEYHCQLPQQDLIDFATSHNIVIEAYSPVGSNGAPVLKVPLIQELAAKYDVTTNEIANAYHILQHRVTLPRSSNLERIRTNIRLPPLTEAELSELYKVGEKNPKRYINDPWGYGQGFKFWNGDTLSD